VVGTARRNAFQVFQEVLEVAAALDKAITMPRTERISRYNDMMAVLRKNDITGKARQHQYTRIVRVLRRHVLFRHQVHPVAQRRHQTDI
jgi:hypothetical protein